MPIDEKRLDAVLAGTLKLSSVPADLSQTTCKSWDSISHLNLVLALESEFGVFFEPEEIPDLRSRAAILAMLQKKLG